MALSNKSKMLLKINLGQQCRNSEKLGTGILGAFLQKFIESYTNQYTRM